MNFNALFILTRNYEIKSSGFINTPGPLFQEHIRTAYFSILIHQKFSDNKIFIETGQFFFPFSEMSELERRFFFTENMLLEGKGIKIQILPTEIFNEIVLKEQDEEILP